MTDLTSLIERIEDATEGSRELDVAVILALHPEAGPYQPYCQGDEPIFWNDPYRKRRCPEISTSIDAALTLMPEGLRVNWAGECPDKRWFYELIERNGQYVGPRLFAATAPLALLAAILRARQTEPRG